MKRYWKPKDDLIKKLYRENVSLNKELSKQSKVVDEAVKYQKERNTIMADNRALHLEVENIKKEYQKKEFDFKWDAQNEIRHLENENKRLNKIIDKFIEWICNKFNFGDSKELVKKFENETRTFIDPVKQMKKEEREKEIEFDRW